MRCNLGKLFLEPKPMNSCSKCALCPTLAPSEDAPLTVVLRIPQDCWALSPSSSFSDAEVGVAVDSRTSVPTDSGPLSTKKVGAAVDAPVVAEDVASEVMLPKR